MGASGGQSTDGTGGAQTLDEALGELGPRGWQALHGVNWPGRPQASLAHVLVGPGGIVVVDVRDWTGDVRVAAGGLWQGRFARPQAVEGALAQCAALTSVVAPQYRRLVRPLICMTSQRHLFGITATDVAVAGPAQVVRAVGLLPGTLDKHAVSGIYKSLRRILTDEQQPGITSFPHGPASPARGIAPGQIYRRQERLPRQEHVSQPDWDPSRLASPAVAHPGRTAGPHLGGALTGGRLALLAAFVVFTVYLLPLWGR